MLLAQLLARHGRGDEAIDVMRALADAHSGDDWILPTLSTLCADLGRPEQGLAHLDALAAGHGGEEEWDLFWMRLPLITTCGGVDEAVDRARAHPEGATSYAAEHIAALLVGACRIEDAVAVLRQTSGRPSAALTAGLRQDDPPLRPARNSPLYRVSPVQGAVAGGPQRGATGSHLAGRGAGRQA